MGNSSSTSSRRKIVFTSALSLGRSSETSAILLAESIRAHAGALSGSPIWFYAPFNLDKLSSKAKDRLLALDVDIVPVKIDHDSARFFFVPEVVAAGEAEERARNEVEILAWLGLNTVVIREPRELLLPSDKNFGYRPVHHTNIGSRFGEPLDLFWGFVYNRCGVTDDLVFPMKTHIDGNTLRPYINAGLLAARPEMEFIKKWRDAFLSIYRDPELERLYNADARYGIFIHQAVLSAVMMTSYNNGELLELPPTFNYPVHLYNEDATGRRPSSLEEIVTFRHEGFHDDPNWEKSMPAGEPLKQWIREKLQK